MPPYRPVHWFLFAALVPVGCNLRDRPPAKVDAERHPRVEVVTPRNQTLPIRIELSAIVEPMEKADLCARIPGVIESLQLDENKPEVDIGRQVRAGEPLIKLAVPDLEAEQKYKDALLEQAKKQKDQTIEAQKVADKELQEARAQDRRYQAEFQRSQDKHDRTLKLVQGGSLNRELAEETRNQLEGSRAAWQAARAQIETKQAKLTAMDADLKLAEVRIKVAQAEVEKLRVLVGYGTVAAPFDGVVTKRWVDRGAAVKDPTTPLVTIVRTDKVRVLLDIPQRDVPLVNATEENPNPDGKGDAVELRIAALRDVVPKGEFRGHITRLAAALDPVTRTMRAEVQLENRVVTREGKVLQPLRPGMYGTAIVHLEEGHQVLTVPSTALVRRGDSVCIFHVADVTGDPPRGILRRVEVELGQDDGKRVEVRKGLYGKESIVAKGNGVLRDGDTVVPVLVQEP